MQTLYLLSETGTPAVCPGTRAPPGIFGFELQLSGRQPIASRWIYRASRSPSLGSALFGCQLCGRQLKILAELLAPELWPSGSPDLLEPQQIDYLHRHSNPKAESLGPTEQTCPEATM